MYKLRTDVTVEPSLKRWVWKNNQSNIASETKQSFCSVPLKDACTKMGHFCGWNGVQLIGSKKKTNLLLQNQLNTGFAKISYFPFPISLKT